MSFRSELDASSTILAEAAITERLRRRDDVELHPLLFNTPLIYDEIGRTCLESIYFEYRTLAQEQGLPFLMCAPTWRVDRDRTAQARQPSTINRDAVEFMLTRKKKWQSESSPVYVGGLVGPKNDCYQADLSLPTQESEEFHSWQIQELTKAGVDVIVAQTFPAVDEAIGVVNACAKQGIDCLMSFVIDRKGNVLDGTPIAEAVSKVDAATDSYPAGYMVNCVYPTFLNPKKQNTEFFKRMVGIQANASSLDHSELEGSEELKQDDPQEWGEHMLELHRDYNVKILGGCCGTDDVYLRYITDRI